MTLKRQLMQTALILQLTVIGILGGVFGSLKMDNFAEIVTSIAAVLSHFSEIQSCSF
jgi:hypothetical protein